MDAVKNDVKRLVKIELAAANKKFRMFAGPHEGVAVIQEEAVEAAQEMDGLRRELNAMWMGVYSNNPQSLTKNKKVIDNSPFGWYNNMRRQE